MRILTDPCAYCAIPEDRHVKRGADSSVAKSDINERPEVGGDGGAQRVVTQAETETFVWLPINNILRRSPKQATGMKYLLAKCNNWQREPKSARSHCFSLEDQSSSNGPCSLRFLG